MPWLLRLDLRGFKVFASLGVQDYQVERSVRRVLSSTHSYWSHRPHTLIDKKLPGHCVVTGPFQGGCEFAHGHKSAACTDWRGDADSKHAALLQAIGEVEPENVDSRTWSAAILPEEHVTGSHVAENIKAVHTDTTCPDWRGDADSKHAALLQAIGEVEPENVDSRTWSAAILPEEHVTGSHVAENIKAVHTDTTCPDWRGDADSKHAALLQAIGEVEPENVDSRTWSAAILPEEHVTGSHVAENIKAVHTDTTCPDWRGDADSKHAALLQAIGEVEPENVDSRTWSAAILPEEHVTGSHVAENIKAVHTDTTCPDWRGDADSKHAALLQAIGEVEPENVDSRTWSAAILPEEHVTGSHVAENIKAVHTDTTCPDWRGDADSRHAALLQAIGEVEPENVDSRTWSAAILPEEHVTGSHVAENIKAVHTDTACPDWRGDADSRHAALLQAIGEVEPENVDSRTWSAAILPEEHVTGSHVADNIKAVHKTTACPDWRGDADSRHAALLQAIGEVEPEIVDSRTWSAAILPEEHVTGSHVAENIKAVHTDTTCPDWRGNADSRHAALLQAIGEVEPENVDSRTWSAAILPEEHVTGSHVAENIKAVHTDTACPDWRGDADSRHAALLQAIGEVEPENVDSRTWSAAILPEEHVTGSHVADNIKAVRKDTACPDWRGDADSRHAALLQAIGEVEPENVDSRTWSATILPEEHVTGSHVAENIKAVHTDTACPDWRGDADSRHAALLQAIGEVEPDDADS